ncbi:tRNA lysidine(34) synthetase TilS [Pseudonocardia sp. N23]|uniref:tRNA lysidine(34) synthetase TilS n=1 Tax=Pseudonocardia sp. N23 TaxID=1987376 RepID=UPI000BFC0B81|nr:tRNA lysidine(34) synthetase TilS [Pseudonocardia sp. N23]GAY08765.1 tRNA(Ile)-lysidine synthetase [Pseudonocardia sp. N23]
MTATRAGAAVVRLRLAVRRALAALPADVAAAPVVVGCSGGADSLALTLAAAAELPGRVHAAIVDHALQDGSAARSAAVAAALAGHGVTATVHAVVVDGPGGTEAAARRARYAALRAARPDPHSPVLLAHTLDDQAETVLLGLGRGSGPRSIAGMRTWDAPWVRPLLDVRRGVTRAACAELGVRVWNDPHNDDPRFTRVRLRHEVLPLLEDVLAGGVAEALARTAAQLRDDGEALDALADRAREAAADGPDLHAAPLAEVAPAVRRRVLRAWLHDAGVNDLTDLHLRSADDLVGSWRGQGGVALPGGLDLVRRDGRLVVRRAEPPPGPQVGPG